MQLRTQTRLVLANGTATAAYASALATAGNIAIGAIDITLAEDATFSGEILATADDGFLTVGDLSIDLGPGAAFTGIIHETGDGSYLTAGAINITAVDGVVTLDMVNTNTVTPTLSEFVTDDLGLHINGASVALTYSLSGTGDATLEVGAITVALDTLSDISIDIHNNTTDSGDIVIGDLTVSGAVGTVSYDGTAATETGYFNLDVTTIGTGEITIGDVDYSGYTADATIDMSWTDLGAANIIGSDNDDTITGNADDNAIDGGGGDDTIDGGLGDDAITGGLGVDDMTGGGGDDIFVFSAGDSGMTTGEIDTIQDWGVEDLLDFNNGAGTVLNYVEGTGSADLADFIDNANDELNSTVKYYADTFGGNLYVAVDYDGAGNVDAIVELVGMDLDDIGSGNIIA